MEKRLAQLRVDMERERAQRERRLATGRLWSTSTTSGRVGAALQSLKGRGSVTLESSLGQAASHHYGMKHLEANELSHTPSLQMGGTAKPSDAVNLEQNPAANGTSSLLNGSFDEDRSRQEFLEALQAWRGHKKSSESKEGVDAGIETAFEERQAETKHVPLTLFQQLALQHSSQEASSAASQMCRCLNHPRAHITQADERLEVAKASCSARNSPAQEGQETGPPHPQVLCDVVPGNGEDGDSRSEDDEYLTAGVQILSISDVDASQALTSRSRLPDAIILP
jgi:hypothetical protein